MLINREIYVTEYGLEHKIRTSRKKEFWWISLRVMQLNVR